MNGLACKKRYQPPISKVIKFIRPGFRVLNLHKNPERPLSARAFQLVRINRVGGYAAQLVWADGHDTGLYSFEYLKRLGEG